MVCSVFNCSTGSSYYKPKGQFTLHSFPPVGSKRRQEWIEQLGRKNFQPSKNSKVCSRHFVKADYLPPKVGAKGKQLKIPKLKQSAVPTLFLRPTAAEPTNLEPKSESKTGPSEAEILPPLVIFENAEVRDTINVQHDHGYQDLIGVEREEEVKESHQEPPPDIDEVSSCGSCSSFKDEILKLRSEVAALKEENGKLTDIVNNVEKVFRKDQLKRLNNPSAFVAWSDITIKNTIHIYYTVGITGFNFLRDECGFPLPCVRTLRNHLKVVSMKPGLLRDFFYYMERKVKNFTRQERQVSVLVDELGLKPGREYDMTTQSFYGHPTMKPAPALALKNEKEGIEKPLATKAMPFMIRGLFKNFKQVVGYHFTEESFDATECAEFLKLILKWCTYIKLEPVCGIMDQGPCNVAV